MPVGKEESTGKLPLLRAVSEADPLTCPQMHSEYRGYGLEREGNLGFPPAALCGGGGPPALILSLSRGRRSVGFSPADRPSCSPVPPLEMH